MSVFGVFSHKSTTTIPSLKSFLGFGSDSFSRRVKDLAEKIFRTMSYVAGAAFTSLVLLYTVKNVVVGLPMVTNCSIFLMIAVLIISGILVHFNLDRRSS